MATVIKVDLKCLRREIFRISKNRGMLSNPVKLAYIFMNSFDKIKMKPGMMFAEKVNFSICLNFLIKFTFLLITLFIIKHCCENSRKAILITYN